MVILAPLSMMIQWVGKAAGGSIVKRKSEIGYGLGPLRRLRLDD